MSLTILRVQHYYNFLIYAIEPRFLQKKGDFFKSPVWAFTDSNRRPSACKADALNQLS